MSQFSLEHSGLVDVSKDTFDHPKYELTRIIAEGGEGVVWEAVNHNTAGCVAIKFYSTKEKWIGLGFSPRNPWN